MELSPYSIKLATDPGLKSSLNVNYFFLGSLFLMILVSTIIVLLTYNRFFFEEMVFGWVLAVANAGVNIWIHRSVLRNLSSKPIFWGLGTNGLRAIALTGTLLILSLIGMKNFTPFLVALMTGYFCFLHSEILNLHLESLKRFRQN